MNGIMAIGKILKELREKNGYTQQQVAKYLGVDQSYIAKCESDERQLSVNIIKKLSVLYGCDILSINQDVMQDYKPILLAYRSTNVTDEDLDVIVKMKKLALNMRFMERLLQDEKN